LKLLAKYQGDGITPFDGSVTAPSTWRETILKIHFFHVWPSCAVESGRSGYESTGARIQNLYSAPFPQLFLNHFIHTVFLNNWL
jgi:hypothetical protein